MNGLLNNIRTQILCEFQDVQSCFIYPNAREKIIAPAVFLEVANYGMGDDPATEELAIIANIEARVVIDSLIENAEIECQRLACKIGSLAHLNNFGCSVRPAKVGGISRDFFKPDFDPYICWLVEWQHELHVGESVFSNGVACIPPHELHIGELVKW